MKLLPDSRRRTFAAAPRRSGPQTQRILAIVLIAALLPAGCERSTDALRDQEPVVYCSVDETFARTVLESFRAETGIAPAVVFDSEAGKTTGLVNKIIAEAQASRPRADVFWSGELFSTILLARKGLLQPYDPPTAADIPTRYRDPQHRWTALAARARVLGFDPRVVRVADVPKRWEDLADPRFARHTALANPLFGTTRGHVAAMFALWGPQRGRSFLTDLRDNGGYIADSNSATVRSLASGRVRFAATDTDDVWVAQRSGLSIELVYPDMGDGGTLLIPCSVALIKGGRNAKSARRLVDYLVSAKVERMLAQSDSRNVPVRPALLDELGMEWPPESKVEFDKVADAMDEAVAAVRDILIR